MAFQIITFREERERDSERDRKRKNGREREREIVYFVYISAEVIVKSWISRFLGRLLYGLPLIY